MSLLQFVEKSYHNYYNNNIVPFNANLLKALLFFEENDITYKYPKTTTQSLEHGITDVQVRFDNSNIIIEITTNHDYTRGKFSQTLMLKDEKITCCEDIDGYKNCNTWEKQVQQNAPNCIPSATYHCRQDTFGDFCDHFLKLKTLL